MGTSSEKKGKQIIGMGRLVNKLKFQSLPVAHLSKIPTLRQQVQLELRNSGHHGKKLNSTCLHVWLLIVKFF